MAYLESTPKDAEKHAQWIALAPHTTATPEEIEAARKRYKRFRPLALPDDVYWAGKRYAANHVQDLLVPNPDPLRPPILLKKKALQREAGQKGLEAKTTFKAVQKAEKDASAAAERKISNEISRRVQEYKADQFNNVFFVVITFVWNAIMHAIKTPLLESLSLKN